ncbi:MAG TPA: formimidoylglutamase, partial [Phototrophicaceae bacterium]|nr:formimidoylglutamase [Phototrophicaceae bacterium]
MTDIFTLAQRPDETLFFNKGDPSDRRLGEFVLHGSETDAYKTAQVIILGCPQDEGVRRNKGRPGAALAPDEIRRAFYKLTPTVIESIPLFDLGNTMIQSSLEATHETHREIVRQVLRDGKTLITLGGGNDLSYPDASALALEQPPILAFNIDTHFDVRSDVPCNSGTPYRQLLDEGFVTPLNFYEMGYHLFANSPVYLDYLRYLNVQVCTLEQLREFTISGHFQNILSESDVASVFWGFDVDVVCAADAPGVSAPNPVGMTGTEFCQIARLAGQEPRTRLIEFTEMNPTFDIDGRTARLV